MNTPSTPPSTPNAPERSDLPGLDLLRADHAGLHPLPASISNIRAAAAAVGLLCIHIDLSSCTNKRRLLAQFARSLQFPNWFGHNWDALADCLGDLAWLPTSGYVLILEHTAALRAQDADSFATVLDILSGTTARWASVGLPFWVFIDGDSGKPHP